MPLLYFALAIFALWLAAMAVWISAVLVVRAVSLLVLYWMVSFTVLVVVGLLCGVAVPLRVLRGKGRAPFRQLSPQAVVDGKAFRAKVRGESRHYGWDRAWPTYSPYQAREDAYGVRAECHDLTLRAWEWVIERCSIGFGSAGASAAATITGRVTTAAGFTARVLPRVVAGAVLLPPFAGFYLGVWTSVIAWLLLMFVMGALVAAVQKLALFFYRRTDVLLRRRGRAEMKCPGCYHVTTLPSYRCSNPMCTVVHRALLPGPLGLRSRRCECGTTLPNTIRRAAAQLVPICPVCNTEMSKGSGNRQTIQVPVIGSKGAGKTRLLAAASVQLAQHLGTIGGRVEGLTDDAVTYLDFSRDLIRQHANTSQTAARAPEGIPLLITAPGSKPVEIQLMDAAGENFGGWVETAALRYLDAAQALVFALDPLPFPEVSRELHARGLAASVLTASGEQEEAYAAAIDRMRAENVRLKDRHLGFVITKADVLLRLPIGAQLSSYDSPSVRNWLHLNGWDLLVNRCEKDFATVTYFLVDSMNPADAMAPTSPARIFEWVLRTCKSGVAAALAPPSPAPSAADPAAAGSHQAVRS